MWPDDVKWVLDTDAPYSPVQTWSTEEKCQSIVNRSVNQSIRALRTFSGRWASSSVPNTSTSAQWTGSTASASSMRTPSASALRSAALGSPVTQKSVSPPDLEGLTQILPNACARESFENKKNTIVLTGEWVSVFHPSWLPCSTHRNEWTRSLHRGWKSTQKYSWTTLFTPENYVIEAFRNLHNK